MQLILVTGLSGSGKSIALKQLEDLGYYCIDNLPGKYVVPVTKHLHSVRREHLAVSLDARSDVSLSELSRDLEDLVASGVHLRILCLTASTDALVQRYSETRRQHPLSQADSDSPETLVEAIERERKLLEPIMDDAHIIDTTGMLPNTLKHWVRSFVNAKKGAILLTFESFGFKKGLPIASDLVFDVRCLPNPYWVEELRLLNGKDQPVIDFLSKEPLVRSMFEDIRGFVEKWLPHYEAQNRHYLTVSIGCTGGQHRSVYICEQLGKYFSERCEGVITRHRTLDAAK